MSLEQVLERLGVSGAPLGDLLSAPSGPGLLVFDGDLRVVHAEGALFPRGGYETDRLPGRRIEDVVPAHAWDQLEPQYRRVLQGHAVTFDLGSEGMTDFYRVHAVPLLGDGGQVAGGAALVVETTDVVAPLLRDVDDYRLLSESSRGFTARHDLEGRLLGASPSVERIIGTPAADLEGRPFSDLLHPDDADAAARTHRAAAISDEVLTARVRLRHAGGHWVLTEMTVRGIADEDGRAVCVRAAYRDVSEAERQRSILDSSERRLRAAQMVGQVAVWEWDVEADRIDLLRQPREPGGPGSFVSASFGQLVASVEPSDREAVRQEFARMRAGADETTLAFRVRRESGAVMWLESRARAVRDPNGRLLSVRGTTQDITDRRRQEEQLRLQAALLDQVDAAVIATGVDGTVTYWNRGAEQLYGWSADEVVGRPITELTVGPQDRDVAVAIVASLAAGGAWEGEFPVRRKDGSTFTAHVRDVTVRAPDGTPIGVVGISMDVSRRSATEQRLRGSRDFLAAITDHMAQGVLTVDHIGRITYANRAAERMLGRPAEELVGRSACELLAGHRAGLGPDCCAFRSTSPDPVHVDEVAFVRGDRQTLAVAFTVSAFVTDDGRTGRVAVLSDISRAKAEQTAREERIGEMEWLERIRRALDRDELVVHAQPIVDLRTLQPVQQELLVRLSDGQGGVVSPERFLPAAEAHGLIGAVDLWVLRRAVRLANAGQTVQVNVSGRSIADPLFIDRVEAELMVGGVPGRRIVFEVTETALAADRRAARRFADRVAALGCRLALDDFGTGYSNFAYLKHLPIDVLKIDRDFIRDLERDPTDRHVVQAVVGLARGFGVKTIAEGVEHRDTVELLRVMGVDFAQGYALGRPGPVDIPGLSRAPDG